jgi:hypothetical protein
MKVPITHDCDLRGPLERLLLETTRGDHETAIWHEFTVCGTRARVDIAVLNGSLEGYEIKSGADRLGRLEKQARFYNRVFDHVTIVCDGRHLGQLDGLIPGWYGIWLHRPDQEPEFEVIRWAGSNPDPSSRWVAQLLWREEMLELLEEREAARGLRTKPRRDLVRALVETFEGVELRDAVRDRVRRRLHTRTALGV